MELLLVVISKTVANMTSEISKVVTVALKLREMIKTISLPD